MIRDANLLVRVCHAPNCIDAAPEGMAFWRSIRIGVYEFKVWMDDSAKGESRIAWKRDGKIRKDGLKVLGMDFLKKGNELSEVRGNTFRDALALYMVVKEMEIHNRGVLSLIPMYLRIRELSDDQLEQLFSSEIGSNTSTQSVSTAKIGDIPKIENQVSSPIAKTIVPVSAFHDMVVNRYIPPPSSTTLPTLHGCHPYAKVISAPPQKSLMSIHTPDVNGQPVMYT